ncbi:MAG: ATP-dependent helicase HrpB, partial [Kiritimatiellae bacterium]|nr:ATP-dependent helicase HrpB [Kiritimatiellia bacterium]
MPYPVDAALPRVARALEANRPVILTAPPGSGKTTRAAPYLLDLAPEWLGNKKLILLEPRRLAARMAAGFMARQRGGSVGDEIGYRIRLENKTSARTRIEILTEGLLTQRLLSDPELADTACILFDEFHERSLAADTGLALALELRAALRPDLRLVIMSATLDTETLEHHLPACEVIEAEGRMFPVETRYAPAFAMQGETFCNPATVARAVKRAVAAESGSVLVFLPGEGEIRRTEERLREEALPPDVDVYALYGALGKADQDAAVAPSPPGRRKVVL